MATMPMQAQPMPAGDEMAEPAGAGGIELCIKIAGDGSISVYKETGEDESAEQGAQQVGGIGEALQWALKEFKAMSQGDEQSQLQAGFGE